MGGGGYSPGYARAICIPPGYATVRSEANQSQISGRDADVDHTQIIGKDIAKLLGGIFPPIPPGFRHP